MRTCCVLMASLCVLFVNGLQAASTPLRPTGKKPYPEGTREAWIRAGRVLAKAPDPMRQAMAFPSGHADNRGFLPPIGDQGNEGSCVHWAGTYYVKTASMKRRSPGLDVSRAVNQCSPRFTYNLSNGGRDNGGFGHEPFELFVRYGVPSLASLPYAAGEYSELPPINAFVEGLHRRTASYVWVWQWEPDASEINELKMQLEAGGVAICGINADGSFERWSAGDAPWIGPTDGYDTLNHMVTVCGYNADSYLVVNSWGEEWGSNGFIYVDADYFEHHVGDVMYPIEGDYSPSTAYATIDVAHTYRSDIRSITLSLDGSIIWSNSPAITDLPFNTGSVSSDSRNHLQIALDLSHGNWIADSEQRVQVRVADMANGGIGTIVGVSVFRGRVEHQGQQQNTSIPPNSAHGATVTVSIPVVVARRTRVDVDGDGISDMICVDASGTTPGEWYIMTSQRRFSSFSLGGTGCIPVSGDFDGDARADTGIYDPAGVIYSPGTWRLKQSTAGMKTLIFGYAGTVPVTGDFDGDGIDDIGCYDAKGIPGMVSSGSWFFMNSQSGFKTATFGYKGTVPVVGDFDGDGIDDIGCYDAQGIPGIVSAGSWFFINSQTGFKTAIFGYAGTVPVIGDFDGDGIDDFGCYDAKGIPGIVPAGSWFFMNSQTEFRTATFGYKGTVPVIGDFDGDGVDDFGCYDAQGISGIVPAGSWFFINSRTGFKTATFGYKGTVPVNK